MAMSWSLMEMVNNKVWRKFFKPKQLFWLLTWKSWRQKDVNQNFSKSLKLVWKELLRLSSL